MAGSTSSRLNCNRTSRSLLRPAALALIAMQSQALTVVAHMDWMMLLATFLLSVLSAVLAGLLPTLADAAHDHIFDRSGINPGAGDQRIERGCGEINRVDPGETAAAATPGSACGGAHRSYADQAMDWAEGGARLIGGCCRTTPADISAHSCARSGAHAD